MEQFVPLLNKLVALGTIGLQVVSIVLLIALVLFLVQKKLNWIVEFASNFAYPLVFLLALLTAIGTLFYSEVVGYPACKLCWYQRIALYPLVIIFGLALVTKDRTIGRYGIALSVFGIVVSIYHYLLEFGLVPSINCLAGGEVDCSQRFLFELGYITFPMMALTIFIFIILLLLSEHFLKKHSLEKFS